MITRDHVIWAYRLLLDREPESEDAIQPKLRAWKTTGELRTDIVSSAEYKLKNPDHALTSDATIVIKPLASGLRLCLDLADHVIGLAILRDRYERDELRFAISLLRPGDAAIDVGAHVGVFALHMAEAVGPAGSVHAFEPLARNANLLEMAIRENRFEGRLTLERAGVSDATGTATLHFARETLNTGGAYIGDADASLGPLAAEVVAVVRLDDYRGPRPVRLIKMDVEGGEPRVIAGARSLLAADRPVIISEVHPEQLRRVCGVGPDALLHDLARIGYQAHRIDGAGLGARVHAEAITDVVTLAFVPIAASPARATL
jgi:FkbM family methyltransferase